MIFSKLNFWIYTRFLADHRIIYVLYKIFQLTGNRTYTVEDFNRQIHDIVEVIRVQLITFYTNKTLQNLPQKCLKSIAEAPALKNITT